MHRSVGDFLNYLAQRMPVVTSSVLVNFTDHDFELRHLDAVCEGDILVLKLRSEEWKPPASMLLTSKIEVSTKNESKKHSTS